MPPNKRAKPDELAPPAKFTAPTEPPQYPPLPPMQPGEVEGVEQLKRLLGMFKYDMQVNFESLQTYVCNGIDDIKSKMDRLLSIVEAHNQEAARVYNTARATEKRVEAVEGRVDEVEDQLAAGRANGHAGET